MNNMFNYNEFLNNLEKIEQGKPRILLIKDAIKQTDAEQLLKTSMALRFHLMHESCFFSDSFDCVVGFPEYMAKLDSLSLDEAMPFTRDFMESFRWYLNRAERYYQIVKKTVDELQKEYKKRCKKYGYSLRRYYMMKIQGCEKVDLLPHYLKLFRREKRDVISAGRMFELLLEIKTEIKFGNIDGALELEKIAHSESGKNNDIIYSIHIAFATYYYYEEEYESAKPHILKAYNYALESPYKRDGINTIISICEKIDFKLGLKVWKSLIPRIFDNCDPANKLYAFRATVGLLKELMNKRLYFIEFDGFPKDFPLYNERGKYNIMQLHEWFYKEAMDLAKKFDIKDETNDFEKSVKKLSMY